MNIVSIRYTIILLLMVLPLSANCLPLGEPTESVPPMPSLQPVSTFTDGITEIPPGKYLFVEYWVEYDGESTTDWCPDAAMIDFPLYEYISATLRLPYTLFETDADLDTILGFFGWGFNHKGSMGGGSSSLIDFIESFPYTPPDFSGFPVNILPHRQITIHSVYEDGTIVAEIEGNAYLIEPGQSWIQKMEDDPSPECHTITTYRFTNYGLIDRDCIDLTTDFVLP